MIELLACCLFWISLAGVLYCYAVYPLLVAACARIWGRRRIPPRVSRRELPTATLLIVAHNEEAMIGRRIENALAAEYPPARLTTVVALDDCSDRTAAIARTYVDRGVKVLDFTERRGKAATLNAAVATLASEIVVFSDANTFFEPSAVRRVARWFADRQVGVVCGRLVLTDPQTGQNVDSLYWRYETFLKLREARLGALLGANGAIYALRRDEFIPLPPLTILDDFVLPLTAKLRSGAEIVYEPKATAWEETPARISAEFGRRARIGAGGFQSLAMLRAIFALRHGWLLFAFVSHKLLRWICPLFLLTMLLATVVLIERELYRDLFVAQLAFYTLALVGAQIPGKSLAARIVRLQSMFCGMNLALAVGFWRFLSGRQRAAWQPAERRAVLNVGSKR